MKTRKPDLPPSFLTGKKSNRKNYFYRMNKKILGIDLGGTKMKAGLVEENHLSGVLSQRVNALASAEEVLEDLFRFSDKLVTKEVKAIGIGVPGLVVEGMVYDVVNIPSWKEIPLQRLIHTFELH